MPKGPRIVSYDLYLRALDQRDISQTYCDWLNDSAVNRFLETRYVEQTLSGIAEFVTAKNASNDEYLFGIFLTNSHRHIGNIKLGPIRMRHRLAEVSLFIGDKSVWGKGVASRTIATVTTFGFEQLGLNKLVATMYSENSGSTKAFLKAGWQQECTLKDHYVFEGRPMDLVMVGMTAREFRARRTKQ